MDYMNLLEHSYKVMAVDFDYRDKLAFIADHIFDFTTYDDEYGALFGIKALEVCRAINNKGTFDYISNEDGYRWYLLMVNMPFFQGKLEWGTSIRGAWWSLYGDGRFVIHSCGLFENGEQITEDLSFNKDEWHSFIDAMVKFAGI